MTSYERIAGLPLKLERVALEARSLDLGMFVRQTTLIALEGDGERGLGEDVVYDGVDHDRLQAAEEPLQELAGSYTLDEFSQRLEEAARSCGRRSPSAATPRATTGAGRSSRRRSTWPCARRDARCPRCSSASRAP